MIEIKDTCILCGKEFIKNANAQKFCCVECRDTFAKKNKIKKILKCKCVYCGAEFTTTYKKKYCSTICLLIANGRKKPTARRNESKKNALSIAEINEKANAMGLSYGQYVARYESR